MKPAIAPSPVAFALERVDDLRRALLRVSLRTPGLARVVVDRNARLAIQSLVSVALLAVAVLRAPGALFVGGPLLFGVAHLASDVRHLVLRRDATRGWRRVVAGACLSLVALGLAEMVAPAAIPYVRVQSSVGWSWVAVGVVLGARAAGSLRRAVSFGAPVALLAWATWLAPSLARSLFAYAHNLVALVIWITMFRKGRIVALPAAAAALGMAIFLASGRALAWVDFQAMGGRFLVSESIAAVEAAAPCVRTETALAIGVSYVFLQAVHYAAWLSWIPQDNLVSGTSTFRMTARALKRELGGRGLVLVAAAALLVAVASLFRLRSTRAVYLSMATFHGWLELACLGFFGARGRVDRARAARAGKGESCR